MLAKILLIAVSTLCLSADEDSLTVRKLEQEADIPKDFCMEKREDVAGTSLRSGSRLAEEPEEVYCEPETPLPEDEQLLRDENGVRTLEGPGYLDKATP